MSSKGGFVRCNLDGTGCSDTITLTAGGTKPNATIFGDRLYVASPSFPGPGIDLVNLSTY